MSTFISHQTCTSGPTPSPLVYGLYTCENVDNYGWPLNNHGFAIIKNTTVSDIFVPFIHKLCRTLHVRAQL